MKISELLHEILIELKNKNQLPTDRLWSVDDVAKFWQVHPNNAYKILQRPDAPKNIGVTKHGRYDPEEIKNYRPGVE